MSRDREDSYVVWDPSKITVKMFCMATLRAEINKATTNKPDGLVIFACLRVKR